MDKNGKIRLHDALARVATRRAHRFECIQQHPKLALILPFAEQQRWLYLGSDRPRTRRISGQPSPVLRLL